MNVERITMSNATTQTDFVKSPILLQCLYVLRTVPEFRNLTYRVAKTVNDVEMIVVYREAVLGVFGPPVDPITLTLEPKGKCLFSIPFKPVQRVSIVSPENGHIIIDSLLAVLRMVAGKGYLFCPGLPERFLAGKACGQFLVLHKVPFKRYQSIQCPVYYQPQVLQQKNAKSSLCALCPRCMQAAKWIQSVPVFAPNNAGKAVGLHLKVVDKFQSDQTNTFQGSIPRINIVTQEVDSTGITPSSASVNRFLFHNSGTAVPVENTLNIPHANIWCNQKTSVDVNGNNQVVDVFKEINSVSSQSASTEDIQKSSVNALILEKRSFLRNLLQERAKSKLLGLSAISKETKGGNTANEESSKQVNKLKTSKQRYKNICHHCKKEFSSPANLMNHLQRHESLSGSWHRQFRERKLQRSHTSSLSLLRMMFRGSKLSPFLQRKKRVHLSETSLRLFLKYLEDLIPSYSRTKSIKKHFQEKIIINKHEKQMELKPLRPVHVTKTENEALEKRFALKRPSSGLSPMQTLIEATVLAEVDQENISSPTISSSSSLVLGKQQEAAVVSTTSQFSTFQTDQMETGVPEKKARKSPRPASKKVKNGNKNTEDKDIQSETVPTKPAATSENQSLLTNLNLLSTVSIEKAMRETAGKTQNAKTDACSIPIVLSPKAAALSIPYSVNNLQQLHNISQGNTSLNNGSQGKEPCKNVNVSSSSDLPSLLAFFQPLPQSTSATSCLLSSLVNVGNKQPRTSFVAATKTDMSPNNNCGAIDLSKPKLSQITPNITSNVEKTHDLAAPSSQLHKIPQFIANNGSPEVLQYLMMMAKTANISSQEHKESQPVTTLISNKQADSDLQAHLFASACNYKINKGMKYAPQVQSVMSTSSCLALPGKDIVSGGSSVVPDDEIQCGYKWSGSGGLVKERTQMVRELVPLHVMESFLSKPWSAATVSHPVSVNISVTSQPSLTSNIGNSPLIKSHDLSESQPALNLTIRKAPEISFINKGNLGRPLKSVHNFVVTPSSPGGNSTSPVSSGISVLKSSLRHLPKVVNHFSACSPVPTKTLDHSTASNFNSMRHKAINLSQSSTPLASSLPAVSITSSGCTISSPSLAAMLLQPASSVHEIGHYNFSSSASNGVTSSTSTVQNSSVDSVHSPGYVKTEPVDSQSPEHGMLTLTSPIKNEQWDPDIDRIENATNHNGESLPGNRVMDISPDVMIRKDNKKDIDLGTSSNFSGNFYSQV